MSTMLADGGPIAGLYVNSYPEIEKYRIFEVSIEKPFCFL
jgi:hypothetical protein